MWFTINCFTGIESWYIWQFNIFIYFRCKIIIIIIIAIIIIVINVIIVISIVVIIIIINVIFSTENFLLNCLIFFNPLSIFVVLESGAVNSFCFLRCFCAFYFAQITSEDRVLSVKNQYVLENKLKGILPPQNIFIKRIQSLPYNCITQFPICHDHVDVFLNDSPISLEASKQLLTSTLLSIFEIKSCRKQESKVLLRSPSL